MKPATATSLRCAIYTRVSTEYGLEQEFNSLHNQREAAEAYIKSQAHEGWRLSRERYDDGGFSGGSLNRPALQRLLADIDRRRIDIVVVYKVDRLTRSLTDFAKLVELFDAQSVSFVSVTQSFNTTSSMGRLTLNVLLSFAQFEREVTGERIRDKIAASKRKGLWVGGVVPFGYTLVDHKLIVDQAEAAIVRQAFARYLVLGSLPALQRELREQGIVTRRRPLRSGAIRGGGPFTNGPLQHLLRNRVVLGELNHKGQSHKGEHAAIVSIELFEAVQARLDANRQGHRARRAGSEAPLMGLLFDDRGHPMSPTYAVKKGVRYRYYVSAVLVQGRREEAGSVPRVSAPDVEATISAAVTPLIEAAGYDQPFHFDRQNLAMLVERIIVGPHRIVLHLTASAADRAGSDTIPIAWSPNSQQRHCAMIAPRDVADGTRRSMRAEARSRLLAGIGKARLWVDEMLTSSGPTLEAIAAREGLSLRSTRMTLSLAFLDPAIIQAACEGQLPLGFGLSRLYDLPESWAEQRQRLGLPARG